MISLNPKLKNLSFKEFKKFAKRFEGKVKETPEELYQSIGGKLKTKKD